jgi:hypothetical protein
MDDSDLHKLIDSWIAASDAGDGFSFPSEHEWAIDEVANWILQNRPKSLWQFIVAVNQRTLSPKVTSVLAAGPLEDLLSNWGEDYIEQVEQLAQKDSNFNFLLGGLWKNKMTDSVWSRVNRVRLKAW